MELNQVKSFFKQRWRVIVIAAIISCIAGFAYGGLQKPVYTANGTLYISVPPTQNGTVNPLQAGQAAQDMASTYADLATTGAVSDKIAQAMGDGTTSADVAGRVSAKNRENSVLVDISATGETPESAHKLADTALDVMSKFIEETSTPANAAETSDTETTTPTYYTYKNGVLTEVDPEEAPQASPAFLADNLTDPQQPAAPSSPSIFAYGIAGLILGFIVGLFLALIIHFADRRLRTAEDVNAIVDLPMLASIPEDEKLATAKLADFESGYSRTTEAFREMAVNLQFVGIDKSSKTVMITSPLAEAGKTTTSVNVSAALAEAGHSVVLVELDLRRPKVAEYLGVDAGVGLTSILQGDVELSEAIISRDEGFAVLPAGSVPPNPTEILASEKLGQLFDELSAKYDFVLIDTAPALLAADAVTVAKQADGTVLVLCSGGTTRDQLIDTVTALEKVHAPIFGTVLDRVKKKQAGSSYNSDYSYNKS